MLFAESFLLVASLLLLSFVAGYALKHRNTPGAHSLFLLMTAAVIWTAGSFFELVFSSFEAMLFWRNIEQIGVFSVPIITVFFAVDYTRQKNLRKYAFIASIIPLSAIILIFTNEVHHFVRSGYLIENSPVFGETLIVNSTNLGSILVGFNFVLPLAAVLILLDFRRKLAQRFKRQVSLLVISFLLTFSFTWLKMAVLQHIGVHISISTLYSPSAIILFYALFKYNFLNLSPIARDRVFQLVKQGIMVVNREGQLVDINEYGQQMLEAYQLLPKKKSRNTDIRKNKEKLKEQESAEERENGERENGERRENSPLHYSLLHSGIEEIFSDYPEIPDLLNMQGEKEILVESGDGVHYLAFHSYPLHHYKDEIAGTVFMIRDITDKKLYELELKTLSETDALTQLKNRRSFHNSYLSVLETCKEQRTPISLLMIDLDRFKRVNDTYGHSCGDLVLQKFSDILRDTVRGDEVIGRLGGEEFGIILPHVDRNTAYPVAECIRRRVKKDGVELPEGKMIFFTLSVGITDNEGEAKSFDEMLKEADSALYRAKNRSRDRSEIYRPLLDGETARVLKESEELSSSETV